MDALNCYLLELVNLHTGKALWGMDCDLDSLEIAIKKLIKNRYLLSKKCTDCKYDLPLEKEEVLRKLKRFLKNRKQPRSKICNNCK